MSIVQCCPYSEEQENCKFEKYYGQPRFDKCSTCDRMEKELTQLELLKQENEQLKAKVSYLEDNLRVARKDRESLKDAVADGLKEFVKEKPFTSLCLLAKKAFKEDVKDMATKWIRSQGWSEENLPNDEYIQMCDAYAAGAMENGFALHNLKEHPDDLPEKCGEYLTNIGVLEFDNSFGNKWHTLLCEACDFYEDVTAEVTAWCELPKLEVK